MNVPVAGPDFAGQFVALRGTGAAADGLVSVEIDGTGSILDLTIQPKAMRMPSEDLSAAVRSAFDAARAEVQDQATRLTPSFAVGGRDLGATLDELGQDAARRVDELTSLAEELATRIDRHA